MSSRETFPILSGMRLAGTRERVSEETHTSISTAIYRASEPSSDPRQNRFLTEEGATYVDGWLSTGKIPSPVFSTYLHDVADEESQGADEWMNLPQDI